MHNHHQSVISAVYNRVSNRGGGREYSGFVDYRLILKHSLVERRSVMTFGTTHSSSLIR